MTPFDVRAFLSEAFARPIDDVTILSDLEQIDRNRDEPVFDAIVMYFDKELHIIFQWIASKRRLNLYAQADALDFYPRDACEPTHSDAAGMRGIQLNDEDEEDSEPQALYSSAEILISRSSHDDPEYRQWLLNYFWEAVGAICIEYVEEDRVKTEMRKIAIEDRPIRLH